MSNNKDVRVFKFITGEEVIVEVVHSGSGGDAKNTWYEVKNGLSLLLQAGPQGFGMSLIPWGSNTKDLIRFFDDKVIYVSKPEERLLEKYEEAFSTIAQPSKTLLVG